MTCLTVWLEKKTDFSQTLKMSTPSIPGLMVLDLLTIYRLFFGKAACMLPHFCLAGKHGQETMFLHVFTSRTWLGKQETMFLPCFRHSMA